jgi:hypothetical protein
MKAEFTALVQQLIAEQGRDALFNAAKCKAFLADYAKGEHLNERRLLLQVVEAGVASGIANTGDLAAYKQQASQKLQDDYYLAPNVAGGVVSMLAQVLRGDTATPQGTAAVHQSAVPARTAYQPPVQNTPARQAAYHAQAPQAATSPAPTTRKKHTKRNVLIAAGSVVVVSIVVFIILLYLHSGMFANSIFVNNSDVYVAGNIRNNAVVWKNGQRIMLPSGGIKAVAESVFVDNNNVYVTGIVMPKDKNQFAVYWKNGNMAALGNGTEEWSFAHSIFVVGPDVYVAGRKGSNGAAVYWKNGQEITTADLVNDGIVFFIGETQFWANGQLAEYRSTFDNVSDLLIFGSDVYCAGSSGNVFSDSLDSTAWYVKNDEQQINLPKGSKQLSTAHGIYVVGSDVYVTGAIDFEPVYWKNSIQATSFSGTITKLK